MPKAAKIAITLIVSLIILGFGTVICLFQSGFITVVSKSSVTSDSDDLEGKPPPPVKR